MKNGKTAPRKKPQASTRRNVNATTSSRRHNQHREEVKMSALKEFFELRDRKYASVVNVFFETYRFQDIAHGIYSKYKILPEGWRFELERMKRKEDPLLDWFDPEKVLYLTEVTESYPSVHKGYALPDRDPASADKVIDEMIKMEKTFFTSLDIFMKKYVAVLEAITQGALGEGAKEALGLDAKEVEYIFGVHLWKVHSASEKFLLLLETLALVPADPIKEGRRAGQVASIINLAAESVAKAYTPYNAKFTSVRSLLMKKINEVKTKKIKEVNGFKHLNFVDLWKEISRTKKEVKKKSIDIVLSSVIQKFPQFKLFFGRIENRLDEDDAGKEMIKTAGLKVQELNKMIDLEVKRFGEKDNKVNELFNTL